MERLEEDSFANFSSGLGVSSEHPVKMVKDDDPKKPLNLRVKILKSKLIVTTGAENRVIKTLPNKAGDYQTKELNKLLASIKQKHKKENSIILAPQKNIPYKKIVQIIDKVRYFESSKTAGQDPQKMFDQIMFESPNS